MVEAIERGSAPESGKVPLQNNKNFLTGLMFIGVGATALAVAQHYPIGTALRMGPGYFPVALGGLLVLFGVYELIAGLIKPEPVKGNWSVRGLAILPLATVVFGLLMERAGFIPALLVLIVSSAWAGTQFRLIEVLLLAVTIVVASVAIFIYGLRLPYPLVQGL